MDNSLLLIKLIILIFVSFMFYVVYINYKKKIINTKEFFLWVFFWSLFIIFTLIPSLLNPIVISLHFRRRMDLATVIGFIFLLSLLYYNYSHLKKVEKRVTQLVSKFSLVEGLNHINHDLKKINHSKTKK